jgi:MFS family permease
VAVDRTDPPDGVFAPRVRALTAGLVFTITLVGFEALAVATVLPRVERDLGELALYGWVFSAYLLASLVGTVVGGREVDRRGPAVPFAVGCALFAAGLVLAGLTPSMPILVLARVVQGLGAGVVPATAYAVIGREYPEELRPRMFAVLSTAWVLPGILGPALAGVIEHALGWRWVFLGLLPLVALAAVITIPALSRIRPHPASTGAGAATVDALAVALGAGLVIGGLTASAEPVLVPVLVAAGLLLGVRPLRRLLPAGTLRAAAGLPAAILSRGVLTFAFFGTDAFVPLVIQEVRHESVAYTSVVLTITTLCWTAGAWVQERLIRRFGPRAFVRVGLALIFVGVLGVAAVLWPSVPLVVLAVMWSVGTFGMGCAYASPSVVTLEEAPPGREGSASAALNVSDQLGFALGAGVAGAAVAFGEVLEWGEADSLRVAACVTATVAFVGILVAGRIPRRLRAQRAA